MKWIKIKDLEKDIAFPCLVTDGKRALFIGEPKETWAWSNYVHYKDVTHYMKMIDLPNEE